MSSNRMRKASDSLEEHEPHQDELEAQTLARAKELMKNPRNFLKRIKDKYKARKEVADVVEAAAASNNNDRVQDLTSAAAARSGSAWATHTKAKQSYHSVRIFLVVYRLTSAGLR